MLDGLERQFGLLPECLDQPWPALHRLQAPAGEIADLTDRARTQVAAGQFEVTNGGVSRYLTLALTGADSAWRTLRSRKANNRASWPSLTRRWHGLALAVTSSAGRFDELVTPRLDQVLHRLRNHAACGRELALFRQRQRDMAAQVRAYQLGGLQPTAA